jgi:protein involved in polysaccharide export with SLBB domain
MRRLVFLLALLCAALGFSQTSSTPPPAAKIHVGDEIIVSVAGFRDYYGDYHVSDDGQLTGVGFGSVQAEGKTIDELKAEIVAQLKKIFKDPTVDVVMQKQAAQFIYVIGAQRTEPILYKPGFDLRQIVGMAGLTEAPELFDCRVSRDGEPVHNVDLPKLLNGDGSQWDGPMQANDVVTFLTKVFHVTVSGEVNDPGDYIVRNDAQVESAIAQAKGVTPAGTLQNVLVFRGQDVFKVDVSASAEGKKQPFALKPGDSVVVRKSENAVYILGEVRMPGRYVVPDNKTVRIADLLALAQGLTPGGSLRRVALVRPDGTGKFKATAYNLDEFLKNGKAESNPVMQSGDIVLFGQPKQFQLASLNQIASTAYLLKFVVP